MDSSDLGVRLKQCNSYVLKLSYRCNRKLTGGKLLF